MIVYIAIKKWLCPNTKYSKHCYSLHSNKSCSFLIILIYFKFISLDKFQNFTCLIFKNKIKYLYQVKVTTMIFTSMIVFLRLFPSKLEVVYALPFSWTTSMIVISTILSHNIIFLYIIMYETNHILYHSHLHHNRITREGFEPPILLLESSVLANLTNGQ